MINLLSTGAAYGVTVAVFQWGWAANLFNAGQKGPIDPWIPVMLFTILFGLSMDYELFLMSRIREEWLRTRNPADAIAGGLASTARVITTAAAIMICVFGAFALSDLRPLKIFGLGMATAVLVDATLSGYCSYRPSCICSALAPGGCLAGSTASSRASPSSQVRNSRPHRPQSSTHPDGSRPSVPANRARPHIAYHERDFSRWTPDTEFRS